MEGRSDERTENLPILQDLIPYRGRCPASIRITKKEYKKKRCRAKGIADHYWPWAVFFGQGAR